MEGKEVLGQETPLVPTFGLAALLTDRYGEAMLPRLQGESQHPAFDTVEEVKMKPEILKRVCRELLVTPCMDLFASAKHHQFPRYFTVSEGDEEAVGRDAFAYEWSPGVCLYANPPWSLIPNVLWKADHDGSRCCW